MNRRDFIKGLLATTAAAQLNPAILLQKAEAVELSGLVEFETFYLDRPAVIHDVGVTIRNCQFIANPGFVGDHVIHVLGDNAIIENCHIDARNVNGAAFYAPAPNA